MARRYTGGFISSTEQVTDVNSANGVFTLQEAGLYTAAGNFPTGGWVPSRSLRFNKNSSNTLSRTPTVNGSQTTFTLSLWTKLSDLTTGADSFIWASGNAASAANATNVLWKTFDGSYFIQLDCTNAGLYRSAMLLRDPAAWYHIVVAVDTTRTNGEDRVKMYVNNKEVIFTTQNIIAQNTALNVNTTSDPVYFGALFANSAMRFLDGYLAEVNFIGGQQLTPSSFGQNDPETNVWVPIRYSGTYGTNGYYLNFSDGTSTSNFGLDRSGNGNNFTANNMTTSGAAANSTVDVPGIASITSQIDIGGVQRGNYCTLNPLSVNQSRVIQTGVIFDGGLTFSTSNVNTIATSTIGIDPASREKYYAEVTMTANSGGNSLIGLVSGQSQSLSGDGMSIDYRTNGTVERYINGSGSTYASTTTWTTNDVMGIALDMAASTVSFYKNNTLVITVPDVAGVFQGEQIHFGCQTNSSSTGTFKWNFGQIPYAYTPPNGFRSICSTTLPNPKIKIPSDHFQVAMTPGNGIANTLGITQKQSSAYEISRSLRFRSNNTSYLERTPSGAGNRRTFTWSGWVKRAHPTNRSTLFSAGTSSSGGGPGGSFYFNSTEGRLEMIGAGGTSYQLITYQRFQNINQWMHVVVAFDTTLATSANRIKVYIDGVRVNRFDTTSYPSQNFQTDYNNNVIHRIGGRTDDGGPAVSLLDGYLAEVNIIDGQQLEPSAFGEFDANNNWVPKRYTGTYGTNGSYLTFSNITSTTTLGNDTSGNSNNWTPNNFSLTAGSTYDSMVDVPTDWYGDSSDAGGEVRGSYPILLNVLGSTIIDAGLRHQPAGNNATAWSSMAMPNRGKWYFEVQKQSSGDMHISITRNPTSGQPGGSGDNFGGGFYLYYNDEGTGSNRFQYYNGVTAVQIPMTTGWGNDDSNTTYSFMFDYVNRVIRARKNNNVSTETTITMPRWMLETPVFVGYSVTTTWPSGDFVWNFGQRPFTYTPPDGFRSLNTKNMQDVGGSSLPNTYGQYANTPDLVVMKRRSSTGDWEAYDTVRGPQRSMSFNTLGIDRNEANGLLGFVPNGFKVGSDNNANMREVSAVYYSWNRGSIPGFDIVTYRGNGASNHEIPHNLGATPAFGIIKSTYNALGNPSWHIYHKSVAPSSRLFFETSSAVGASGMWGTTSWSSSNIYVGWDGANYGTNFGGNTYIGYLWAEVPGFSRFGSYIGNGSTNGPFVNLGFRPKWLMIKNTTYNGEQWAIIDSERYPYNDNIAHILFANSGSTEDLNADYHEVDFLSNGFKVRGASQQLVNFDGHTFVYFAFAESPFKYANAR